MRIVYFDCFSGVAGDMVLGALLDLGVDFEAWCAALRTLPASGFEVAVRQVRKGPIACRQVEVRVEDREPHHRHLAEVLALVNGARLPRPVKASASAAFRRLAEAEGRVHGEPPEAVTFHEVGGLDALVDITGACLALHMLGVEAVYCSPVTLGRTQVDTAHGRLPAPAPAALELLTGCPVAWCDQEAELATPTGAALVTTLAKAFGPPPPGRLVAVGYGAGDDDHTGRPNALRAVLLESAAPAAADRVVVLETNLDDMSPEHVGALMPGLLAAGALDVFATPVTMKKGRPGLRLTVLAPPPERAALVARLLRHTSTFGVRVHEVERAVLDRKQVEVETEWGTVRVKVGLLGAEEIKAAPEHEDCARLAEAAGVSVAVLYRAALAAYHGR